MPPEPIRPDGLLPQEAAEILAVAGRGLDGFVEASQAARIVDGQVARRRGDGVGRIEAAGAGAAGQHDDQVGAERGELADDVAPGAVAQRGQNDDGGNADRHGEYRQRGA